jgi:hypothetical protein
MTIDFFADPGLVPKPRAAIRIEDLRLIPYTDGYRVRLEIELTPFGPADRPNLDIEVSKPDGTQVAAICIIESIQRAIGITVHLREPEQPRGTYHFRADLYYGEESVQHSLTRSLVLPDGIQADGEA